MQQPSGGAPPCGGSADQPNYAGGFVFAHGLSGSGLPSQDQNTWSCFSYDGAGRLVQSDLYTADGDDWNGTISYSYGYDPNGNLTGIETGVPSAKAQGAKHEPKFGPRLAGAAFPLQAVHAAAAEGTSTSFSRSGADQLTSAKLASGTGFTLSYDSSNLYGDVGQISSGSEGYALALTRDAHTRQVTAQTISNNATGETVLTASMAYDPMGRRTSRSVTAVDEGSGSSTTEYWYGKALVPLVVERDGATYRMIGGLVIEERVNGEATTQYYPHRDYTSSVRVVTDGTGAIAASLGYDGDWGSARIAGQDYVSSDAGMEAFYRFQSQEAEIFPLSTLNISDAALETWLDELQLHHFPYREYSAGLAVFLSQDPAKQSISPYAAFGANPANVGDPTGAVGGWFSQAAFRDFVFTATWGATSVSLYAWLQPKFEGSDLAGFYTVLIMGFGRWVGNTAANIAYHRNVKVSGREILVRGMVPLDNVQPESETAVGLVATLKLEAAEAVVAYFSGLVPGGWTDAAWQWKALAFSAMALMDALYGSIRDRNAKWAYYMADDRGGDKKIGWAIFRRGSSDAVFYTLVAIGWEFASPTGTIQRYWVQKFTFSINWVLRNFSHRVMKDLVWKKAIRGIGRLCIQTTAAHSHILTKAKRLRFM
jgi:RHS repeat-associated protein